MSWKEATTMSERMEFIEKALRKECSISQLCSIYNISRKTGYKWLRRFQKDGPGGLMDQSRRPLTHPMKISTEKEDEILTVSQHFRGWGGKKLHTWLIEHHYEQIPSASTITAVLRRNGKLDPEESQKHRPFCRFQMEGPNLLWQMDFKGRFQTACGESCSPLVVMDDATRYLLTLTACPNQTQATIQTALTQVFRTFGLPERMLMDNGSSWSGSVQRHDFTHLSIWLIRLGISLSHGRARHPQTQGKVERLNRSLDQEVLNYVLPENLADAQRLFTRWFYIYNQERPHEALGMKVPASSYLPSSKAFPETLPPIEYPPGAVIRKVDGWGKLFFHNHRFRVGKSFQGLPVQILPEPRNGHYLVYFLHQPIAKINLRRDNLK